MTTWASPLQGDSDRCDSEEAGVTIFIHSAASSGGGGGWGRWSGSFLIQTLGSGEGGGV